MNSNHQSYLLLGSNLGDRISFLENGIRLLNERVGKIQTLSAVYETEAWGLSDQPAYLNMAAEVATQHPPKGLLALLKEIEKEVGRKSDVKNASREIDIDILLYDDWVLEEEGLIIPHPRMHLRKFVLQPLSEIAPDVLHPVFNKSIAQLLNECNDNLSVKMLGKLKEISIAPLIPDSPGR